MPGYPYDTGTSFIRYPSYYIHDAFGHVGADDIAAGRTGDEVCFRKIPHTGLDVSPKKRGDTTAKVVSPVYGTIIDSGFDAEAGNWHFIQQYGTGLIWILGHHSMFVKRSGNVERGELIARMGMTGGAKGVHTHISVAKDLAAARKQITGYISYRNGRSVAAWAAYEGLLDPWPLIEKEWAAHVAYLENLARAEAERLEAERAAAKAAAEAQAKAEAEARAKEDAMKTRKVQIGNDIYVSCAAEGFLYHVPNTLALPAADVMVDDPSEPTVKLSPEAGAALIAATLDGRDSTKVAAYRSRISPTG